MDPRELKHASLIKLDFWDRPLTLGVRSPARRHTVSTVLLLISSISWPILAILMLPLPMQLICLGLFVALQAVLDRRKPAPTREHISLPLEPQAMQEIERVRALMAHLPLPPDPRRVIDVVPDGTSTHVEGHRIVIDGQMLTEWLQRYPNNALRRDQMVFEVVLHEDTHRLDPWLDADRMHVRAAQMALVTAPVAFYAALRATLAESGDMAADPAAAWTAVALALFGAIAAVYCVGLQSHLREYFADFGAVQGSGDLHTWRWLDRIERVTSTAFWTSHPTAKQRVLANERTIRWLGHAHCRRQRRRLAEASMRATLQGLRRNLSRSSSGEVSPAAAGQTQTPAAPPP